MAATPETLRLESWSASPSNAEVETPLPRRHRIFDLPRLPAPRRIRHDIRTMHHDRRVRREPKLRRFRPARLREKRNRMQRRHADGLLEPVGALPL
jgi:hypothetical protein